MHDKIWYINLGYMYPVVMSNSAFCFCFCAQLLTAQRGVPAPPAFGDRGSMSMGVGGGAFVKKGCFSASSAVALPFGFRTSMLRSRSRASAGVLGNHSSHLCGFTLVNVTCLGSALMNGQSSSVGVPK